MHTHGIYDKFLYKQKRQSFFGIGAMELKYGNDKARGKIVRER